MWRPYWNSGNENDILCNLMPYTEYWNSGVCGPNQNICEKFNFLWLGSARAQSAQAVTEQNIESLATMLQKEYRFTASLYQYKTLIIFIGEDNSFTERVMWENTYSNYGKLMNFINSKPEWKMNIKFGTIKEYFERIRTEESNGGESSRFPILSGDFFPYSEKDNDYWTGYFTTRPWMKRFTREIEALIRAADKFSVILYNHCLVLSRCENIKVPFTEIMRELRTARREVGIYQHHYGHFFTSCRQ
jgi:alpha-mannosidase II